MNIKALFSLLRLLTFVILITFLVVYVKPIEAGKVPLVGQFVKIGKKTGKIVANFTK
jgi:hypothetical protein